VAYAYGNRPSIDSNRIQGAAIQYRLKTTALTVAAGAALFTLSACSDDDVAGVITVDEYFGEVQALNASAISGTATISLDDVENDFAVSVEAFDLDESIVHIQHVHAGDACPTSADDANGDGFVDVVEGLSSYGGILIPLDSDLTNQAAGDYPSADLSGDLNYDEGVQLDALTASLRPEDDDPFVELEGPLLPDERTIVLHGVDVSTELPSTVQTLEGLSAQQTLPIGCVELELVPTTLN